MKVKTVIIWDALEADLKYFVVDGDYRHLDKHYINMDSTGENAKNAEKLEALDQELTDLLYDDKYQIKADIKTRNTFPVHNVRRGAFVISCGWLP